MSPTSTESPVPLPVVSRLVDALEAHGVGDHSHRVASLAAGVCRRMGLSARPAEVVVTAALLHDVGKLAVPSSLLAHPGRLSREEWALMRDHAEIGARTLSRVAGLAAEATLVLHSHERWDGLGYPAGLAGTRIPLGARIIAACDAWDAMTTDRPYREARPHHDALEALLAGAGAQFDVDVVAALVAELSARGEA